jgi:hypothetical protein
MQFPGSKVLPESTLRSHEDFLAWYSGVKKSIKANTHEVKDLSVADLGNGNFTVKLTVLWKATPYTAEY